MYMNVTPSGFKFWRHAFRFDGKEKLLALGFYPEVALWTPVRRGTRPERSCLRLSIRGEAETGQAHQGNRQRPNFQSPLGGMPEQAEAGRVRPRDTGEERMAFCAGQAEPEGAAQRRHHGAGADPPDGSP